MQGPSVDNHKVDLSRFNNDWYSPGASAFKRAIWFFINGIFLLNPLNPFNGIKTFLLRAFGSKIGRKVVIKPNVNIKYPWNLTVGDNVWIGEGVWIDNLAPVTIGDNSSISQGALLLTGTHNYKKAGFDLMIGKITLEDGVWIGAKGIVCPGVTCKSHSILTVGSVATTDMESYCIYQGVPAEIKRQRVFSQ